MLKKIASTLNHSISNTYQLRSNPGDTPCSQRIGVTDYILLLVRRSHTDILFLALSLNF